MTTLILAQQKIMSLGAFSGLEAITGRFLTLNRRGTVTILLVGLIFSGTAIYLVSIYAIFNAGLAIQNNTRTYGELRKLTLERELTIQDQQTMLAEEHSAVLQSMERIGSIKYLSPTSAPSYSLAR